MRQFSSYGPVDSRFHFCVERRDLVESAVTQLVGYPGDGVVAVVVTTGRWGVYREHCFVGS